MRYFKGHVTPCIMWTLCRKGGLNLRIRHLQLKCEKMLHWTITEIPLIITTLSKALHLFTNIYSVLEYSTYICTQSYSSINQPIEFKVSPLRVYNWFIKLQLQDVFSIAIHFCNLHFFIQRYPSITQTTDYKLSHVTINNWFMEL